MLQKCDFIAPPWSCAFGFNFKFGKCLFWMKLFKPFRLQLACCSRLWNKQGPFYINNIKHKIFWNLLNRDSSVIAQVAQNILHWLSVHEYSCNVWIQSILNWSAVRDCFWQMAETHEYGIECSFLWNILWTSLINLQLTLVGWFKMTNSIHSSMKALH